MSKKINSIGELIQTLRLKNNLSTAELANQLYVSRQTLHYWEKERNRISAETLTALGHHLGEAILIKNGEFKILEENNMKTNKEFKLDFANFDLENILNEYNEKKSERKEVACEKFVDAYNELKANGYEILMNTSYDLSLWTKESCDDGTIIIVSKNDRTMEIVIDKASSMILFDLDSFISDIKIEYGAGVGDFIKKSICFSAHKLGLGSNIYACFKNNRNAESIVSLLPTIDGYEDIVHNQLKGASDYFKEIKGAVFDNELPLSYLLDICDEFSDDYIWISLEDENEEKRFEQESFSQSNIIADALVYIKDNFDDFDTLFEDAVE